VLKNIILVINKSVNKQKGYVIWTRCTQRQHTSANTNYYFAEMSTGIKSRFLDWSRSGSGCSTDRC